MCVTVGFLAPLGGQLTTLPLRAEGQREYAPACSSPTLGARGVPSQYFKLNTLSPPFGSDYQIWVFLVMFTASGPSSLFLWNLLHRGSLVHSYCVNLSGVFPVHHPQITLVLNLMVAKETSWQLTGNAA